VGWRATCGLRTDQSLWCWGNNLGAALGANGPSRAEPIRVGTEQWLDLADGSLTSAGIRADGTLWQWGITDWNDLAAGASGDPIQFGTDSDWKRIDGEVGNTTCALKQDDSLWCWGSNGSGGLGDGSTTIWSDVPVAVAPGTTWKTAVPLKSTVCAIRSDGTLWCWGGASGGLIGTGQTTNQTTPKQVGSATNWTALASGAFHYCGVQGGTLLCWGANNGNQSGPGTALLTTTPTAVTTGTWTDAAGGYAWSFGIRSDGTLWGWGANNDEVQPFESLPSSVTQTATPVQLGSATDWRSANAGQDVSCAIKQGGALWCWGTGHIGDGTSLRLAPARVSGL
jgi:alpha-tubulin suppressor-like RCC1 family protein